MAKVNDTASFVLAGRLIHGDKYGYECSAYEGSSKPITIRCRTCYKEVRLANAGSHTNKNRPSGCRWCNQTAKCKCKFCGTKIRRDERTRYKDFKRICETCWKTHLDKKQAKQQIICKGCGGSYKKRYSKDKYCSPVCKPKPRPIKEYQCVGCGNVFKAIETGHHNRCCSRQCQQKFRGSQSQIHISKTRRLPIIQTENRHWHCGECREWVKALEKAATKELSLGTVKVTWRSKLNSIASCNRNRRETSQAAKRDNKYGADWDRKLSTLANVRKQGCKWKAKLSSIAGNQRKRLERKSRALLWTN